LGHDGRFDLRDGLPLRAPDRCGRPTCRGTITGKDWMKPELREKYKGWFCWFLQRKIDAETTAHAG
jgi:hypothetical protein